MAARIRPFAGTSPASYPAVIGCDEVGRGALCGPVIVAAVWFDPCAVPIDVWASLDDSKRLSARQRERLHGLLATSARVAVAAGSVTRIDRYGIRASTLDAMRRAIERLAIEAPAWIDGVDVPAGLCVPATAVVRGETVVPQIAAASIVAKVFRDRMIARLGVRYPAYNWQKNAGYGTAEHVRALIAQGPSPHHRHSFEPVARSASRDAAALDVEPGSGARFLRSPAAH